MGDSRTKRKRVQRKRSQMRRSSAAKAMEDILAAAAEAAKEDEERRKMIVPMSRASILRNGIHSAKKADSSSRRALCLPGPPDSVMDDDLSADTFKFYYNEHKDEPFARRRSSVQSVKSILGVEVPELPETFEQEQCNDRFRKRVCASSAAILFAVMVLDDNWVTLDAFIWPTAFFSLMVLYGLTDASTIPERIFLCTNVLFVTGLAVALNLIADHDCTLCALQVPNLIHEFFLPQSTELMELAPTVNTGPDLWKLIVLNDDSIPQTCAVCLSFWTATYEYVAGTKGDSFIARTLHAFGLDAVAKFAEEDETTPLDDTCFAQDFNDRLSPRALREMDEWYEQIRERSRPKGGPKRLLQAVATGLGSELGSELLANTTRDLLCHPSSRMTGPVPSDFILSLRRPKFTGESTDNDSQMNVSMSALQRIMRGDAMSQLSPHVCFMARLAGLIPEDTSVLTDSISPGAVMPIANETKLLATDGAFLYPGLMITQTDEDKDRNGRTAAVVEALLSLYIRLPEKDWDPVYFDSKEEYIAFFRWNIEHRLQDEFYFPKWLSHGNVGVNKKEHHNKIEALVNETGELVSHQFRYNSDRLLLTDPTSDETLSDRAFFGTGMKRMTRIKLPGDADFGYLHPATQDYYETLEHNDFFSNHSMPDISEFLRMGNVFWGTHVPLEEFRNKVVEINYNVATHWDHRAMFEVQGAILYLEAASRKPMGIWVAAMDAIVLPTAGRLWDYAKFHYRTTELTVMALRHVAEYHLGWANIFSNAIRQTLPPNHGMRVFIKPYTHGTAAVNWNAYQMLVLDRSILDRASGLTRMARGYTWGQIQKHFEMHKSFPIVLDEKRLSGMQTFIDGEMRDLTDTIPLFTQGLKLYNVHKEFVEGMLNIMFANENELLEDKQLKRFWYHINTYGRHMDPCVCGMEGTLFFEPSQWPSFEADKNRSCKFLMDTAKFELPTENQQARRERWCRKLEWDRTRALHALLSKECEEDSQCPGLSYTVFHMRANFALPKLSREALVDVLATFIFEVTAGHELVADNIPYMVDPMYGGVRLQRKGEKDKLPLKVDVATYIFGTVIAALTTIRSKPLLSDWSNLLIDWAENQADLKELSDSERAERKLQVAMLHFEYKAKLVSLSNEFMKASQNMPKNRWSPFLIPATQATSIAV